MNPVLALLGLVALSLVELLSSGTCVPARADASEASVTLGGIRFLKESRISMEKQRLWISDEEIRVEYDFLNHSNVDITADVAFPLADRPCFSAGGEQFLYGHNPEFKLWVNGTARQYGVGSQAVAHKHIHTALLRKLGIDVATCGHEQEGKFSDIAKLPKDDLRRLSALGLLSRDGGSPMWTVQQFYYWKQTFPAGRIVHVRHTYKPGVGHSEQLAVSVLYQFQSEPKEEPRDDDAVDDPGSVALSNSCLDPTVGRKIARNWGGPDFEQAFGYVYEWVDYVLMTANNWQGPIRDFELNVQGPDRFWVDFCWTGPVERLARNHVRVKASNFSPHQDLHILFFPD